MFKKTTKIYLTVIILTILVGWSVAFIQAQAQTLLEQQNKLLNTLGETSKYGSAPNNALDARQAVANKVGLVLGAFLAGLGVIFLAYMVYSGYQWMGAGGDEEKITKARTRIVNASIGLAIIALSYGVTSMMVAVLGNPVVGDQTTQSVVPPQSTDNCAGAFFCAQVEKCVAGERYRRAPERDGWCTDGGEKCCENLDFGEK